MEWSLRVVNARGVGGQVTVHRPGRMVPPPRVLFNAADQETESKVSFLRAGKKLRTDTSTYGPRRHFSAPLLPNSVSEWM